MNKALSFLLAMIFFFQALPTGVIAETLNPAPTAQELSAALALTGLNEDAPIYRSGMQPSANMNAMQLAGWIHEFQNEKQDYIMDIFENYDVELAYVKENYPTTFNMLKSYSAAGIGRLYDEYSAAKAWRDDVHYYDDLLTQTAARIDVLSVYLQSDEITEREQVIYAYEMRDKWRALQEAIPTVVERTEAWTKEYDRLEKLLTGEAEYSGSDDSLTWLLNEVDNLRMASGRAVNASFSVSASAVRVAPDQTLLTRMARLSPIANALADSDQKMNVKILDDKSFGIVAAFGESRVSGASITVGQSGKAEHTETAAADGSVMFPIRDYQNDTEGEALVNIKLSANGYRRLEAPGVWVKKGEKLNIPMQKDDGKPYPVSWSFWGHDMQASTYTLVTSPLNDTKQPIALTVSSPADYHLKVYFTDKNGKNPVTVGEGDGGSGDKSFNFEGQWLMKAPAEGKLLAEITSGGETHTYQAQLNLKASVLQKPLGDPNLKNVLKPGFQITFPNGWVKPLGGMKIDVDIPVISDKWKMRAFFDINGSGAITIGTRILEDASKKLTENWKTQDQKDLDKAVKKVKGQGYMAETKAKNGGDWAGRSKWSPLKLGAVSLELSFFAFAQVQYTDDGYDYGRVFGKGGAGFTGTVKGSYTLMWPLAQLSMYLSATFTIFPEIAIMADTYWPNHQGIPEFRKIEYAKAALNIILRIELGVEACAGLKGILSLSIRGIGYLEFIFRTSAANDALDQYIEAFKKGEPLPSVDAKKDTSFKIYGGGSVEAILEIFWTRSTFNLIDPPLKWELYPEFKKAQEQTPTDPVHRFIAAFLSSAQAEEENRAQEGGGQVETDNRDLMIQGRVQETWNEGTGKTEIFTMRPLGRDQAVPMMLYIQQKYMYQREGYNRPVLVGTPLNDIHYVALTCEDGLGSDHYLPTDGYDVIDFDYWVADVSAQKLTTHIPFYGFVPLNDVLFTVCILAKDYHDELETLSDGTERWVRVPNETWAYISCYCLDGNILRHVLMPQEKDTNNYLALCYPLRYGSDTFTDTDDPCAYPRIAGTIRRLNGDPDTAMYQFDVITNPVNVDSPMRRGFVIRGEILTAQDHKARLDIAEEKGALHADFMDIYMQEKIFHDYHFFPTTEGNMARLYLTERVDTPTNLYELAFGVSIPYYNYGQFSSRYLLSDVVSMTSRGAAEKPQIFFLQKAKDGENFRLLGCKAINPDSEWAFDWTYRDYDMDMPRTDLQWTKLYGRECIYWMETAGLTEDEKYNLFRVRAVWYDETTDTVSEPFVIATVQTPAEDGAPMNLYLADDNEGFYLVKRKNGNTQLYRFDFKLVPGLKLVGNVLTETLANPGSYDDMLITVLNNGNIPLTGFDLVAYHEENGKQAEAFETIHLDLINPENNRIDLRKGLDGATEQRYGENVARAENSSLSVEGAEYRYGRSIDYRTQDNGTVKLKDEEKKDLMKPKMLMPGAFKAFNVSLLIPQGWEGNHHIYMVVDRFYTSANSSFQQNLSGGGARLMRAAAAPQSDIISIGRDGVVRRENSGMRLLAASNDSEENAEDLSMYKSDVTFDQIELDTSVNDLSIKAQRWDSNGVPMVTLVVTNWAHIGSDSRSANSVVMEAFMDEETTPSFRYILPDEVSDKETWNFDLPLSLLTGGRSGSKVTVKIEGKDYDEVGDVDNSAVILLDTDALSFLTQPESQNVPLGSGAAFHAAAIGGRMPYKYQWQMKTAKGEWAGMEGETSDTLTLKAVTREMNGSQYRLTVTDASGYSAASSAATLTVKQVPLTGDSAPVLWYCAGLLAALGIIACIVIKKKKEGRTA